MIVDALSSVSITSLLGALGAAGAAVAITYYFLCFLREESEKHGRLFQDFRDYHAESQKKFQDQLDRLSDRHEQSLRTCLGYVDGNTSALQKLERTISALSAMIDPIYLKLDIKAPRVLPKEVAENTPSELQEALRLNERAIKQAQETIAALRRQVEHLQNMCKSGLWAAEHEYALRDLKRALDGGCFRVS